MPERKKRLKQEKKLRFPQRAPKNSFFKKLNSTPEGRAQSGRWSKLGNAGRKPGTPDGHSAESIKKLREKNRKEAERVVEAMNIEDENLPEGFAEKAKDLLTDAYTLGKTDGGIRDRLHAMKIFLEYTMPKPVQKNEVTIGHAEAFLDQVVADIDKKDK